MAQLMQLKIGIPENMRDQLDQASVKSHMSLGEEIRARVERTFEDDATDPQTLDLMGSVRSIAALVKAQTGKNWFDDMRANRVMMDAIVCRMFRRLVHDRQHKQDDKFEDDELPADRPLPSGEKSEWGWALEGIDFAQRGKK